MVDLLVTGGTHVTMDPERRVIDDGAIAIDDGELLAIGHRDDIEGRYEAEREIDATGHAVLPGLISSHVHVSDILLRGGIATDRGHYDWLFNIKFPGVYHMTPEEHGIASALYCSEAIRGGVTTFVENGVGAGGGYSTDIVERKFEVYDNAGIRNVYGQSFVDTAMTEEVTEFVELITRREPSIDHHDRQMTETGTALDGIEGLIERFHGTAGGRQHVWPAPVSPRSTTREGLIGSAELAERHDVMTTTHVAETPHDNAAVGGDHLSMTEYLHEIGYLGDRALLGHCVHLSDRDIRLIRRSGTRVAHNPLTNLALGAGFARIPTLRANGIPVGLGTDNTSASDTINMINDLRFAALLHKAVHADPGAMTAEAALEMATIQNARAIGMADQLGSLESGKRADVVILDLDHPHLTPHRDVVSAIVYQAQGHEVDTVICDGEIVMAEGRLPGIDDGYPDLLETAERASMAVIERAGFEHLVDRPWVSV